MVIVGVAVRQNNKQTVFIRGRQNLLTSQTDGQTVPIPSGSQILKNAVIFIRFLIVSENMENCTPLDRTVGRNPYRKTTPGQTFCNHIALGSNSLLTVLLGGRGIQQNINGKISVGRRNCFEKQLFFVKNGTSPDPVRAELAVSAFLRILIGVALEYIPEAISQSGNTEHMLVKMFPMKTEIFLLLAKESCMKGAGWFMKESFLAKLSPGDMQMAVLMTVHTNTML